MPIDTIEQAMWSFVRGDMRAEDFERWVYSAAQLEGFLGKPKYLELLSAGFRDKHDIYDLQEMLRVWLDGNTNRACDCITWNRDQVIPLRYETRPDAFFLAFDVIKERNSWLELARCKKCGQAWYIATDTVDDDYRLLRLTNKQVDNIVRFDKWPTVFDDLKNVWPDPNYA